ncbi:hypothetical protein ACWDUL_20820 [Nocardia niigatensis]
MEIDPAMWEWLRAAVPLARSAGAMQVGPQHLLVVLLTRPELVPVEALRAIGFDPNVVFAQLIRFVGAPNKSGHSGDRAVGGDAGPNTARGLQDS